MNAPQQGAGLRGLALAFVAEACGQGGPGLADAEESVARLRSAPVAGEAALVELAGRFRLGDGELLAAALCLAAETEPHSARRIAAAQAPIGGARPLAGFAATLFARFGLDCLTLLAGPGASAGLFRLGDEDAPLPERSLRMDAPVVAALCGLRLYPEGLTALPAQPTDLPAGIEREADSWAERLRAGEGPALLAIRTPSSREAEALAHRIAGALGLTCADMGAEQPCGHAAWLAAARALPVVRASLGPGERFRLPATGAYRGPLLLLASPEGLIDAGSPLHEWRVPIPDEEDRSALWEKSGLDPDLARRAAAGYRHGAGRIAEIAARMRAAGSSDDPWRRLTDAIGAGAGELDQLARRSSAPVERSDLVIPHGLAGALDLLLDRIQLRNRLAGALGPSLRARYRPGVTALFTGESGTGKTLAAHWIARQAGLPLYRVDLAAMTSKWIGETEKNLSTLLDAAQHADVLLFFDEADSLFGARTEVGDSHDRFANAQTNYLLQRIEDFEGVAILATNSRDRFDPAFVRRLDSILEFPLPDAAARRALWAAHLGDGHALEARETDWLALSVDLAGGHIRNMVLSAAVRAGARRRPICGADVAAAAAEEYAKLGRSPPPCPWL
ncbi:MAG TPA: ATP-binding protein [Allosphingosinicella sp.]|nr:ATP-binding protein [Allosphingosinicella sp.]